MRNVRTKRFLFICGCLLFSCLVVTNFYAPEPAIESSNNSPTLEIRRVLRELGPEKTAHKATRWSNATSSSNKTMRSFLPASKTINLPRGTAKEMFVFRTSGSTFGAVNLSSRYLEIDKRVWINPNFLTESPKGESNSLDRPKHHRLNHHRTDITSISYPAHQGPNRLRFLSDKKPRSYHLNIQNNSTYSESSRRALWPQDSNPFDDRILAQLNYVPRSYAHHYQRHRKTKKIYVPGGLGEVPSGRRKFVQDGCTVDSCSLTTDGRFQSTADLVLLQIDAFFDVPPKKPDGQVWMLWLLESPMNTAEFRNMENVINWTATYRSDSTIVTPYEKFVRTSPPTAPRLHRRNYAKGKTKMVAWFVSNCLADNSRWEYLIELRQYVPVDVFGACGDKECQRENEKECNEMLRRDYKFYLSFENSNCEYYITEKFFQRALWNDVVPIAMGARREDYTSVAPPHSFIHVEDFASPRLLANYLLQLNSSDELYNEYFAWKAHGSFENTKFWCRICALLHDDAGHVSWYPDVEKWWRRGGVCTRDRWDDQKSIITDWAQYFNAKTS